MNLGTYRFVHNQTIMCSRISFSCVCWIKNAAGNHQWKTSDKVLGFWHSRSEVYASLFRIRWLLKCTQTEPKANFHWLCNFKTYQRLQLFCLIFLQIVSFCVPICAFVEWCHTAPDNHEFFRGVKMFTSQASSPQFTLPGVNFIRSCPLASVHVFPLALYAFMLPLNFASH